MNGSIKEVLDLLDLEAIEVNIFRGVSPKDRWQRVFGGQVLGQALVAAMEQTGAESLKPLIGSRADYWA